MRRCVLKMEKLVAAAALNCAEEKQIDVLEKCLQLTRPEADTRSRQLGWLLLTRILEKCSATCMRTGQSRLSKKVLEMCGQPADVHSALFLRQLLLRNPKVGELHSKSIDAWLLQLIDQAVVGKGGENVYRIALELWSIRYGISQTLRILATLDMVLKGTLVAKEDRSGLLDLRTLGQSAHKEKLANVLYTLLAETVKTAKHGESLERAALFDLLERGVREPFSREAALDCIAQLADAARWALLPLVPRIVSMLVSLLDSPSRGLFSALLAVSTRFSSSSTLHKHLFIVHSAIQSPIDQQEYAHEASELIANIIETSAYLIKSEVLSSVQRSVCEEVLSRPRSVALRRMLRALLSLNHELLPAPVHVARTVLASPGVVDSHILSLCDALTRPRLQNLAMCELRRRPVPNAAEEEKAEMEMRAQLERVLPGKRKEEEIKQEKMGDNSAPVAAERSRSPTPELERPQPKKKEEKEAPQTMLSKNQLKKMRKRKAEEEAEKAAAQAVLEEGEASVEDILGAFVPQ